MNSKPINPWLPPIPTGWEVHVQLALTEDIGPGDVTSLSLPIDSVCHWMIECQATGVLCGAGIIDHLMNPIHDQLCKEIEILLPDGSALAPGSIIAKGVGQSRRVMTLERTVLNYLTHLSGISTLTRKFVDAVANSDATIIDTRKTTPGLRNLEKYAVRCGGGSNHRVGLFDGILIKDNHISAAGSIQNAIGHIRDQGNQMLKVEVECDTESQVDEALKCGADIVLLDNMSLATMKSIVDRYKGKALFEASGGITLESVTAVGQTGVDFISTGTLTHSAPALAIHMEVSISR